MTHLAVLRKSFNPMMWQTWVYTRHKLRAYRFQLADRVNARSGSLAQWIRWPLGLGIPHRWKEIHVLRIGGIGDSLLSTPALRLLKQLRPRMRIVFYTPFVDAFRGLPYLDEVRHSDEYPYPTALGSLTTPRVVWYMFVMSGYRDGAVELLYEGSLPPRRHIARIFGDQLGLDVTDIRPDCVFDESLIHEYQQAWAHLPRPWIMVNRKSSTQNKNWMSEHWDQLIDNLLDRYTIIETGAGPEGHEGPSHPHYVDLTGKLPINRFLAVTAAADLHVGPMSGPVHIAAAAGKPSVVIYGGYEHPDCSKYSENVNLFTPTECSQCWLLLDRCRHDLLCLRRISPEQVERAVESLTHSAVAQDWHQVPQFA